MEEIAGFGYVRRDGAGWWRERRDEQETEESVFQGRGDELSGFLVRSGAVFWAEDGRRGHVRWRGGELCAHVRESAAEEGGDVCQC